MIDFETVKPGISIPDYANTQHQTSLEKDGGRSSVHLSVTDPPHVWDEFTSFRQKMFEVCDDMEGMEATTVYQTKSDHGLIHPGCMD